MLDELFYLANLLLWTVDCEIKYFLYNDEMVTKSSTPKIKVGFSEEKNKYGQYFTPKMVAEFMVGLTEISPTAPVLEPSCGEGVFLDVLNERGFTNLTAYEIDKQLATNYDFVRHQSFVAADSDEKFDLIIGNPPYIRWKNLENDLKSELENHPIWNSYFNSLCDYLYIFILKSIKLLNENGQLIFICPEYWLNTTHSLSLRNYMVENGYFECIYHFNETPVFDNASVSVVIFKYIKSKTKKSEISITKYYKNKKLTETILSDIKNDDVHSTDIDRFSVPQFEKNQRWLLTKPDEIRQIEAFEHSCTITVGKTRNLFDKNTYDFPTIGEICDIGNGMVSGLDKAFQLNGQALNPLEQSKTIKVIKAKDLSPFVYKKTTQYIFVNDVVSENELKTDYPVFFNKLYALKERLNKRYNYNKQINFWEWVFLRNYTLFSTPNPRIFVPCKERISNKNHFRFTYVSDGIFPTQDVTAIFPKSNTKESIFYILAFLNNHRVFNWLKNKGIIKGNIVEFSEKPISSIPFRTINWATEKQLHDKISHYTQDYLQQQDANILKKINHLFDQLLEGNYEHR